MRRIFIAHEYGDESHFKALYNQAEKHGYKVSGQIILKNGFFLGKVFTALIRRHSLQSAFKIIFERLRFYFLKNEILIVGIAPYNRELNKYQNIFRRNKSFYFTSQTVWDGSGCIDGTIQNKREFEQLLQDCFYGAFCVTEKSKRELLKFVKNISVVNHSIETSEYKKSIDCKETIDFLYIGQYIERKNISLILNWFKYNDNKNVRMTFIGKGEQENIINEQCQIDKRISNLGFCSKDYLKNNIYKYDFLILPSDEEPFGIVLIEALASGVPCIVSSADGPSEIITNKYNGFTFNLKSKEKNFNDVMNTVCNLTIPEREALKVNALHSSLKYDTSKIFYQWSTLIEKI